MLIIYKNAFIMVSIINVIALSIIDFSYLSLLMYLNSLNLNYILYKDVKFEKKYKYSNINFLFSPNYYPSNRTFNKYLIPKMPPFFLFRGQTFTKWVISK